MDAAARRETGGQLIRYVFNGGLVTGLFALVYWIVVQEIGQAPQLGTLCGYLVAVCVGYALHSKVTFRNHGSRDHATKVRFVVGSLFSYALNVFWTWACTAALHWPTWTPLLPMCFATPMILFIINRWWVFQ